MPNLVSLHWKEIQTVLTSQLANAIKLPEIVNQTINHHAKVGEPSLIGWKNWLYLYNLSNWEPGKLAEVPVLVKLALSQIQQA